MDTTTFRDVHFTGTGAMYRTGMTSYGDGLCAGGIYRSFGWNVKGYPVGQNSLFSNEASRENYSFWIDFDGQSLINHWKKTDTELIAQGDAQISKITLVHENRPVTVRVCTKIDGSPVLCRWLEITNTSDKPAALGKLAVFSGVQETTPIWREKLTDRSLETPYRLGYFEYANHMHEGQFKWHLLPNACYSFGGRYIRQRYRHPFFILENKAKGTTMIGQLAYSGGYRFSFDCNAESADCPLTVSCELDAPKPLRVIAPGETIVSPEMIIGLISGDMDEAINGMHSFVRHSFLSPKALGKGLWLETAGGGTVEDDERRARIAAQDGFDIFYLDASWFYPRGMDCLSKVGDWEPDPVRYPNGLEELRDYCRSVGLKFGIWMEPERMGSFSEAFKKYEHLCQINYDGSRRCGYPDSKTGGVYDLAKEECAKMIEYEINHLIERFDLDFFRLDFNTCYEGPFSFNERDGYLENVDFRYNEVFYGIFDRLRKKFPNVIFENCASGGGRTDLGAVKYFDHTWVTDNPIAPRSFGITNGMTMCLPPEIVDRLVTTMGEDVIGDITFNLYQMMFVRPTSHFPRTRYSTDLADNPVQSGHFLHFMDLYRNFARKVLPECKIYHHTPAFDDREPKGVGMLEAVASDSSRAMFGVFALSDPEKEEQLVRFKGIDASKKYEVVCDASGDRFVLDGWKLKYEGITVRLRAALTAELVMLTAIE